MTFQHFFTICTRLSKLNTSICTFTLVKPEGRWTVRWVWNLHIYYRLMSYILNKVVKMEEVEKGLDRTAETLLAFFRQTEQQQQKSFICKEANYRSMKVKIIPSVTFLHCETESQKWKHPVVHANLRHFWPYPSFPRLLSCSLSICLTKIWNA